MLMSMQQIFTKCAVHLLRQNKRSAKGVGSNGAPKCYYRGLDGLKCAVGVLITDEAYKLSLEGESTASLPVIKALYASGVVSQHDCDNERSRTFNLLHDLQTLHDRFPIPMWQDKLATLAGNYGLQMPNLVELAALCVTEEGGLFPDDDEGYDDEPEVVPQLPVAVNPQVECV